MKNIYHVGQVAYPATWSAYISFTSQEWFNHSFGTFSTVPDSFAGAPSSNPNQQDFVRPDQVVTPSVFSLYLTCLELINTGVHITQC